MLIVPPITPFGDRILVKPLVNKESTSGGIVIADVAQEQPQYGLVVAVGVTVNDQLGDPEGQVLPGMIVGYGKFAGTPTPIRRDEYLSMRKEELMHWISDPALAAEFLSDGVSV